MEFRFYEKGKLKCKSQSMKVWFSIKVCMIFCRFYGIELDIESSLGEWFCVSFQILTVFPPRSESAGGHESAANNFDFLNLFKLRLIHQLKINTQPQAWRILKAYEKL